MKNIASDYLYIIKNSLMGTLDTKQEKDWRFSFQSNKDFKTLMTNGYIRTLIGPKRLDNIEQAIKHIITNQIEGDILEAGCWRGGALLYLKACLHVYEPQSKRVVYGADLFPESQSIVNNCWYLYVIKALMRCYPVLPKSLQKRLVNSIMESFPNENYSEQTIAKVRFFCKQLSYIPKRDMNKTSRDDLIEAFKRYQLADDNVQLYQGWFDQSFPLLDKKIDRLALLRVDADFYQSTLQTLEQFYPKLAQEGICIIDDYGGFDECKRAVDEYRNQHNITAPMQSVDGICYSWKK